MSVRGSRLREAKRVIPHPMLPTPREIEEDPELAVLAAVAPALDALTCALLAAHPVICDHERPYWLPKPSPAAGVARQMITVAGRLGRLIERYRSLVAEEAQLMIISSTRRIHARYRCRLSSRTRWAHVR